MRTEPPSPLAQVAARLRGPADRARRWFADRGAPTRVALLLAVVAALGSAGYLASGDDPSDRAPAWLYEDRKLSSNDLDRVDDALDIEGIERVTDRGSGKVGVKAEVKKAALDAIAKHKATPRTLEDLGEGDDAESPWLLQAEREARANARLERVLKLQIEQLDPAIISASVRIHRERARGLHGEGKVAAFVYLQTEGRLGHRVIDGIETFLTGDLPDLKPGAITVADRNGYKYLAAGDPSLKEQNRAHTKEEEYRDKILGGLRHIPGVVVSVLLQQVAPPPAPAALAAAEPAPDPSADLAVPNGRVVVDPDPAPAPALPISPETPRIRANVLVQVPRSFYLDEARSKAPDRQPSNEEMQAMAATTRGIVEDAVRINIPADILGDVKVDNVQDDRSLAPALLLPRDPRVAPALADAGDPGRLGPGPGPARGPGGGRLPARGPAAFGPARPFELAARPGR